MDAARKLELLWDKLAVEDVMLRFGRALDLHDWAMYRETLLDEIEVDFQSLTGQPPVRVTADLWTRFAQVALEPLRTLHQYSNHRVSVRGERATSVLYMEARHHLPGAHGSPYLTQLGWYENEFVRSGGHWKIAKLRQHLQWTTGNAALIDFANPELQQVFAQVFGASGPSGPPADG
jgi:hypothetical protein